MHSSPRAAFFEAADVASDVLASDAVEQRWHEPSAVEGFSVGGLAGHVYAAVRRLEVALDEPLPESPKMVALPGFYGVNRVDHMDDLTKGLHPLIREDGERRAQYGAASVHDRFGEVVSRLRERLSKERADRLVPVVQVPDGVVPLDGYLATRVVELVVHSDDIATSVALLPVSLPATAASVVIDVCVELARARSGDLDVVRAFTRAERANPDTLRVL